MTGEKDTFFYDIHKAHTPPVPYCEPALRGEEGSGQRMKVHMRRRIDEDKDVREQATRLMVCYEHTQEVDYSLQQV